MVCLGCFIPFYKIILLSSRRGRLWFFFFILYFLFFRDPRAVSRLVERATDFFASHAFDFQMKDKYCTGERAGSNNKQTNMRGKWGNCGVGLRRWKCEGVLWKFCIGLDFSVAPISSGRLGLPRSIPTLFLFEAVHINYVSNSILNCPLFAGLSLFEKDCWKVEKFAK